MNDADRLAAAPHAALIGDSAGHAIGLHAGCAHFVVDADQPQEGGELALEAQKFVNGKALRDPSEIEREGSVIANTAQETARRPSFGWLAAGL